jgi:predicted transcriptional regulator
MACGKLEIDILNSVWNLTSDSDGKDISIQDVVDDLSSQGVERAYTTIKTVMDRLTAKSILVRYKVGKKFFYSATMNREEMARESLEEISSQFFGGNYVDMIRFVESQFELVK